MVINPEVKVARRAPFKEETKRSSGTVPQEVKGAKWKPCAGRGTTPRDIVSSQRRGVGLMRQLQKQDQKTKGQKGIGSLKAALEVVTLEPEESAEAEEKSPAEIDLRQRHPVEEPAEKRCSCWSAMSSLEFECSRHNPARPFGDGKDSTLNLDDVRNVNDIAFPGEPMESLRASALASGLPYESHHSGVSSLAMDDDGSNHSHSRPPSKANSATSTSTKGEVSKRGRETATVTNVDLNALLGSEVTLSAKRLLVPREPSKQVLYSAEALGKKSLPFDEDFRRKYGTLSPNSSTHSFYDLTEDGQSTGKTSSQRVDSSGPTREPPKILASVLVPTRKTSRGLRNKRRSSQDSDALKPKGVGRTESTDTQMPLDTDSGHSAKLHLSKMMASGHLPPELAALDESVTSFTYDYAEEPASPTVASLKDDRNYLSYRHRRSEEMALAAYAQELDRNNDDSSTSYQTAVQATSKTNHESSTSYQTTMEDYQTLEEMAASCSNCQMDFDHLEGRHEMEVSKHEMEISPGVYVPFRGPKETWKAVMDNKALSSMCLDCGIALLSVPDCEHVVCPDCHMVNPIFLDEANSPGTTSFGVGMGIRPEWASCPRR